MQTPIESMNLMLLNVGFAHHYADWNWQNVSSPFIRIYYVTEGEALLHMPQGDVPLLPGHLYTIPAYTVHSCECHGLFNHYYLHIYEGMKNEMNLHELFELPVEVVESDMAVHLFEYLCSRLPDAHLPQSDPSSYDTSAQTLNYVKRYNGMALWEKMDLRGVMLMIISHFIRYAKVRQRTYDDRMKRVLSYIHTHICDTIDVEQLAAIACVTKTYFIKLFKREFGIPPIQYINKKKVERAQHLLFTTDKAVKELAYTLGFSDQNYFIRLFRKQTGTSPLEYRKRLWLEP